MQQYGVAVSGVSAGGHGGVARDFVSNRALIFLHQNGRDMYLTAHFPRGTPNTY